MSKSRTSSTSIPSTPSSSLTKLRNGLFTPSHKRTPSSASTIGTESSLSARLSRVNQPVILNSSSTTSTPAAKKYKAPLSAEAKKLSNSPLKPQRSMSSLAPIPGTPSRDASRSPSRPRTPNTPRKGSGDDLLGPATSQMDVSNVDPEQVLVDSQTVEPGDVSAELDADDAAWLKAQQMEHGKDDKVMVSIRIRPSEYTSAWVPHPPTNSLKLDSAYSRSASLVSTSPTASFTFDSVLTGTPNKPIYTTVARSHVHAAMEGYNAVIFAYGQTASGKTFTLSGNDEEPGIIPRSMREVFGFIKRTPEREYLLRCSYLEIYNETVFDLLAPPMVAKANPVQIQGGAGGDITLTPLREEVVTSLKGVKDVLKRGEGNRRTACTDWNERSSRSHSVFRLVIESRLRSSDADREKDEDEEDVHSTPATSNGRHTPGLNGRQTPGLGGRQTPGLNGRQTPGPGGARLQARGGRSVQTSVLSLIDLAGSEKATSDKERTREGKYINTSLLTLGTVISTLADAASKKSSNSQVHVPYRNSKLTRILQPSLSGNARISVVCTINPDPNAVAESMSTLLFAKRIKSVQLNAKKKEVVDTDALIERYRKEIEELKARLAEREADAPVRNRRLSAREQIDESKAMKDLNSRIQQLTKLILTSNSVDENAKDGESRPVSPVKVDFDMSPYQLQQELLNARLQIETQANQILSLEASLLARPPLPSDAPTEEKDKLIADQAKTIREFEIIVRGYEESLGEPLRKVKEDVEREWEIKVQDERKKREEKEKWAEECVKALEKEKKIRTTLEDERRALAAFVTKFDSLGLSSVSVTSKLKPPMPTPGGAQTAYQRRQSRSSLGGGLASNYANSNKLPRISDVPATPERGGVTGEEDEIAIDFTGQSTATITQSSPLRLGGRALNQPSLFDQDLDEMEAVNVSFDELNEVENQLLDVSVYVAPSALRDLKEAKDKDLKAKARGVFGAKENLLPARA
ncbi:P-loop containing nucleoside triphosphate hydrolase protein [Crepidotus variabilis]|uniref:Kinesin-like protein n=1 Tax=Crepidotus variabilis TaxID=179855 RepID=A0A9P6EBG2_9AGAR|nr:P-loop containing nucleoside triphosphate hydrolase protein [Crepidotus variabilis]